MPTLSIITVNYNNIQGLKKTFDSVFNQICKDYEYLVIDGASTDDSKGLIQANENKITYWVSEADAGMYDAMNKGIQKSIGKYIMFLNSGDYLIHNKVLGNTIKCTTGKKADIYYGNIQLLNETGTVYTLKFPPVLTLDFWENSTINHQASLISSALFKELGLYKACYSIAADYAFYLKAYVEGKKFEYINEDWVYYQTGGASSLHMDIYKLEMKTAWKSTIPFYLENLYKDNKAYSLLMQNRLMKWAKNLNVRYQRFKGSFKK